MVIAQGEMAWEARSGLKLTLIVLLAMLTVRRNGLGSPFGFETKDMPSHHEWTREGEMAWEARSGLKPKKFTLMLLGLQRRNGLGSPFGFETPPSGFTHMPVVPAKWPGKPVRV